MVEKKYQSEQLMVIHQDAVGLYELGLIDDATMREFDKDCLVPKPEAPQKARVEIRQARTAAYTLPRKA
jgi:DNA-binding transcriptional regulator YiaG